MDEQKCPKEISLPCCGKYTSLAFDGCNYYLLKLCSHHIFRLDCRFCEIDSICTCRTYSSLCYDCKNCCFWAASANCNNVIFKLDCNFKEIDRFYVAIRGEVEGVVTGLSFDACKNRVLVSFTCGVISFCIKGERSCVVCKIDDGFITSVLSISPFCLIVATHNAKQCIVIMDECGNRIKRAFVPSNCVVQQIIYCHCKTKSYFISLVEKKGCYQKICFDNANTINLPCEIDCCCDKCAKKCCCCGGCNPHCDVDIVESIALVEAAVAHILNAEGEKLQKVLATTDDLDKIMCVNREINQTIVNATQLEQVLYQKLLCAKELKPHPPCDDLCCVECDNGICED